MHRSHSAARRFASLASIEVTQHQRTKASICTRGNHAGSRSLSKAQHQNRLGSAAPASPPRGIALAVAFTRSRARTGDSPEKERSRSHLRSSRSGYRYRVVALPGAAPRSHAPRFSRGTSSHAPGAQLKIGRVPSTGIREGNALIVCSGCDFSGPAKRGERLRAADSMRRSHRAIQ